MKAGFFFSAYGFEDLIGLRLLGIEEYVSAFLNDAGLLKGNFAECAAENLSVVHTDGHDDGGFRGGDDICGVEEAAHSGLEDDDVAVLFVKIEEHHCNQDLELSGLRFSVSEVLLNL